MFLAVRRPEDISVYKISAVKNKLIDVLVEGGLAATKNEARRLIQQGSVYLDGRRLDNEDAALSAGGILKVGKRRFLKLER